MAKSSKKMSGFKIALLVVLGLFIAFILWALLSPDDTDYLKETYSDDHEINTTENPTMASSLKKGIIRDKKVSTKGNGDDVVTIMIYMNGSNLETDDSEATTDLKEILKAGYSDKVNILVQTMNTKKWSKDLGISNDHTQIYKVDKTGLRLVKDNLGQLSCNEEATLRDFVIWGAQNYPADRYILQFWNHGGGPVYGFGYDDITESEDSLVIDEMQSALKQAGVYFDFIGMDCCLMSSLEVACALYDFCDYMILSEDFESGLGWAYTDWIKKLYSNTSISTPELGKLIIDDMVAANANDKSGWGSDSIMALIDESYMQVLYKSWTDFAYANESTLLSSNYSQKRSQPKNGRVHPALYGFSFFFGSSDDEDDAQMADYFVTDIMAVAGNVNSTESEALKSAISNALIYVNSCGADTSLTGISVTLPYGDSSFYQSLSSAFGNCGFESEYINWLGKFTSASGSSSYYNYDSWDDSWQGWDDYDDDYDWSDWDGDDDYNYSDGSMFDWSVWDYLLSWNYWLEDAEDEGYYTEDENGGFLSWLFEDDDDWYYGDEYSYDDDWYSEDYYYNDHRHDDWYDDDYYDDDWDDDDEGGFWSWLFG